MPDREKAIRILEGNYKSFVLCHNGELLKVNELIALLKAQETVEPKKNDVETANGGMTMRLIDADALKQELGYIDAIPAVTERDIDNAPTIDAIPVALYKAEIETLRSRCYPGAEDAFGRKAYGCLKIVPVSYGTKSVDAIPVEWLRDKMRGYASALKSTETAALVMVLTMWEKEQEAR